MAFEVLSSGLLSTIQDEGRHGLMHRGITPSGAMDKHAYRWALRLLGEESGNAIEAMVGLKLKVLADTTVAIAGADLDAQLDGKPVGNWCSFAVKKGQVLHFAKRRDGVRAYVAVKGGFTLETMDGSVASTVREKRGYVLKKRDLLPFVPTFSHTFPRLKAEHIPCYSTEVTTLRLLPSYQYHDFSTQAKETFFNSVYEVTIQSSAMGYRLSGDVVEGTGREILSEAIAYGAVQIPADGQPIVLLSQRQTIGGYPKMGVVVEEDCYRLAQLPPGAKVRFVLISFNLCTS